MFKTYKIPKSVLFVCSANIQRSKTAEDYFKIKHPDIQFKSAGTNWKACEKHGSRKLEENLLKEADIVYLMEERHKQIIEKHVSTKYSSKFVVLDIPDVYPYGDEKLLANLITKVTFKI